MPYEIHPTQESVVCTPDGGVIECKHEAAAKRVRDELNERTHELTRLRAVNAELLAALDGAWIRMDRARDLLTGGTPTAECNWGMLDTSLDRAAIKNATT